MENQGDGIGIMDNAVTDGIRQGWVTNLLVPATDFELRAEDGGCLLVAALGDLQQVTGLGIFQRIQQPLVQDEQFHLFILPQCFAVVAFCPRDGHSSRRGLSNDSAFRCPIPPPLLSNRKRKSYPRLQPTRRAWENLRNE